MKLELRTSKTVQLLVISVLALSMAPFAIPYSHAAPSCSPAGSSGLTTLMVAKSGQRISSQTINAAGCDVAIFVPPGSKNVVITRDDISGAGIHGIFVQNSFNILITKNNVHDNSAGVPAVSCDFVKSGPCVNEGKAIQLDGASNSMVSDNKITNDQFGGIGIADNGPVDPGALNPGTLSPANNNIVIGNQIINVAHDCGIVVAVYNQETASNNLILNNNVEGSLPPFGVNPYVGQIVVATDGPNATIRNTFILNNVVNGSTLPGIVVHSNAPGDVISGTFIIHNKLGNNGYYPSFFSSPNTPVADNGTTAISLVAEAYPGMPNPPTISGTVLINNTISADQNGVWLCKTTGTAIINTPNHASTVTNPVVTCGNGGN
ncbi:MAG TPA: right-handed parallel beta-helix repeat-containing protein [Candidatus Bathyarchaeia archaeon]|nr:right-handed parallel beta-helix repeat-containing protein [Candidatus Bathyarchaeia archaeon]